MWATGEGAKEIVKRALNVGRGVDMAFDMREHPAKRELFANKQEAVEELREMITEKGTVGTGFKMLGINYECTNQRRVFYKDKSWEQAERRCKRIRMACRERRRRAKYVRMLVLPKVLWGAAWERALREKMGKLRISIEKCMRGRVGQVGGRSPCWRGQRI